MRGGAQVVKSVLWTAPALANSLAALLPGPCEAISSESALSKAMAGARCVLFVDQANLAQAEPIAAALPVVAVIDDALTAQVKNLDAFPWLHHVINDALVTSPMGRHHLQALVQNLAAPGDLMNFLGPAVEGRIAQLARASRRHQRVERVGEYLEERGVGARTALLIRDVAEELLTNAFYDASVAGGFLGAPVPRTVDLELPPERACEIAYGIRGDDLAFVKVRDRFGSLARARLVQVLMRCAGSEVDFDESMGGAGLGMWRIFSVASFVALSVAEGRSTDILVGILRLTHHSGGPARASGSRRRPQAVHLFFNGAEASLDEPSSGHFDSSKSFLLRG